MKKMSKKSATLTIIAVTAAVILAFKFWWAPGMIDSSKSQSARVKGPQDAPVNIVEFIDFQCPACANGSIYLKQAMEEYPGQIRLEMRYFPLSMHAHAFMSSRYAQCAAREDMFWPFHDALIERQSQWSRMINARPVFDMIAKDLGLDLRQFEACLSNDAIEEVIRRDIKQGRDLGVQSTPTYFINGEMVVGSRALGAEIVELLGGGAD